MLDAIWQGKLWQAFKTFAIILSFTINFIVLLILLLIMPVIIPALDSVAKPIVGGLNDSFIQMGEAEINRTIAVENEIPVVFDLPVNQQTTVVLLQPVPLNLPANFTLPDGGGFINGTVAIQLPTGLQLPIALNMTVPVSESVPVELAVDVNIPLDETELGPPFQQLQDLFGPLDDFLAGLPTSNEELLERVRNAIRAQPAGPDAAPLTARPN